MLKLIAAGTKVFTIGSFYKATVIESMISERGNRVTKIRWDSSTPGITEATRETVWVQMPGRTPRFIIGADQD